MPSVPNDAPSPSPAVPLLLAVSLRLYTARSVFSATRSSHESVLEPRATIATPPPAPAAGPALSILRHAPARSPQSLPHPLSTSFVYPRESPPGSIPFLETPSSSPAPLRPPSRAPRHVPPLASIARETSFGTSTYRIIPTLYIRPANTSIPTPIRPLLRSFLFPL